MDTNTNLVADQASTANDAGIDEKAANANSKRLMSAIARLEAGLGKVDNTIHLLGVESMDHAFRYGDARPMDRMYKVLGKSGYRALGFRVWVEAFSPIRWSGDNEVGILKTADKRYVAYNLSAAEATPFWTMAAAKEKTAQELSIPALRAIIERKAKELAEANEAGQVIDKKGAVRAIVKGDRSALSEYIQRLRAA